MENATSPMNSPGGAEDARDHDGNGVIVLRAILGRHRKNLPKPASLRGMATYLGLSPAYLSQLLSGKRHLNPKAVGKIASKIPLTDDELDLLNIVAQEGSTGRCRSKEEIEGLISRLGRDYKAEDPDEFHAIADWYHIAILEMTFLSGAISTKTVAERLGIPMPVAKDALRRLVRLGKLQAQPQDRYRKVETNVAYRSSQMDSAFAQFTGQMLALAEHSLKNHPTESRLFCNYTLPLSRAQLPEARKLVRDFSRKMMALCKTDPGDKALPDPTDVFQLSVQLFNLTDDLQKPEFPNGDTSGIEG